MKMRRTMYVLPLFILLALINSYVYGQQGLPFQVNSKQTCATQISIDTRTLTGVKRGDEDFPCSGYLMYTNGGLTHRMCTEVDYGLNDYSAERACYTLGVNYYRDTNVFDSSTTRQMQLFECFNYKEQGVDSAEEGAANPVDIFYTYYQLYNWMETGCGDAEADPDAFDCFDTCYFTSPNWVAPQPVLSTEESCHNGDPFFALGCADINECENGVRDHCTGPYRSNCIIRKACGNNTDCTNHAGSFECSCKNGFEYRSGDSFDPYDLHEGCKDVDECKESRCDVNAKCVNTVGSYLCWCKEGFMGDGKTCTPITCKALPELPNTKYKYPLSSHSFGDTVLCECEDGYKMSVQNLPETLASYYGYTTTDSFALTCDEKGDWGPLPYPQCIPVDCGDPGVVLYAKREGMGFWLDQEVTYTCDEGFQSPKYGTSRSFTRECQADGTWTEGSVCVDVDECQQQDVCKDDQYCLNTKGSFLCLTGIPDNCDIQGFCKNGECELIDGRAECLCDGGYSGLRCESPMMSMSLILSIVAIVLVGVLIIIVLVVLCMRSNSQPKSVAVYHSQNVDKPDFVSGTTFPRNAFGFRRPPFPPLPPPPPPRPGLRRDW